MKRINRILGILVIIIVVVILTTITVSDTYLEGDIFYRSGVRKQPINTIKTVVEVIDDGNNDNIVEYTFTEDKNEGNYIYLMDQFPTKDEVGKKLQGKYKAFDFKINFKNNSVGVKYQITLEKLDESNLQEDWVKVYLEKEGSAVSNCVRKSGRIKTYNEYEKFTQNKENSNAREIVLYSGEVTSEDVNRGYQSYTFRMWISEDVTVTDTDYSAKKFVARVNLYATGEV